MPTNVMNWSVLRFSCVLFFVGVCAAQDDVARPMVEKALPFLEREGESWMELKGCVSCHHVSFMVWAHQAARTKGFKVEKRKLESWTNWAFVNMLARGSDGGGIDTMSQMLLGRDRGSDWRRKPKRHYKTVDPYETLYGFLVERQNEDGSWPAEGQLRTPARITTGWTLLALQSRDEMHGDPAADLDVEAHTGEPLTQQLKSNEEHVPAALEKARTYLASALPHATHEDLVLRVLAEVHSGKRTAEDGRRVLLARQNEDGGWAQLATETRSDAFATGQTLYALGRLGTPSAEGALNRARAFLQSTQGKDGSWRVSAIRVRGGKPRRAADRIYGYWATAWATIGLLRTLPET